MQKSQNSPVGIPVIKFSEPPSRNNEWLFQINKAERYKNKLFPNRFLIWKWMKVFFKTLFVKDFLPPLFLFVSQGPSTKNEVSWQSPCTWDPESKQWSLMLKLVMGLGQIFLTRVRSAIYGLGLNLENFPWKHQFFNFFPFGSKKISSGQVKKYLRRRQVSLLFTAGQK